jgi:hypothetical protein
MSAAAMANWAAGSSGVGPGVYRRVFLNIFGSPLSDWLVYQPTGQRNHRIHIFVVFVNRVDVDHIMVKSSMYMKINIYIYDFLSLD